MKEKLHIKSVLQIYRKFTGKLYVEQDYAKAFRALKVIQEVSNAL